MGSENDGDVSVAGFAQTLGLGQLRELSTVHPNCIVHRLRLRKKSDRSP